MNDLELMLVTIGDLEFTRRKLIARIQELEKELESVSSAAACASEAESD